jgi:hypothetical protein
MLFNNNPFARHPFICITSLKYTADCSDFWGFYQGAYQLQYSFTLIYKFFTTAFYQGAYRLQYSLTFIFHNGFKIFMKSVARFMKSVARFIELELISQQIENVHLEYYR